MTASAAPSPMDVLVGMWTHRAFLNDPDLATPFDKLEFGRGHIRVDPAAVNEVKGLAYGDDWSLTLNGSTSWGNPFELRFEGRGIVRGEEHVYDCVGYVVRRWPNGIDQRLAIVGSIVRTVPHASGTGGVAPAGLVCSWIAVKDDPAAA